MGRDCALTPVTATALQELSKAAFDHQFQSDQQDELAALEYQASNAAGLRGSAVAVWDAGGGRMAFLGPRPWHSFLASINLRWVFAT